MKTYLYWSKIAPLSPAEVQEQLRLIPYEKQLRLQKMHNQEQRIVSLWAERLLRYGLQKSYHLNIEEKSRKVTPEGKPYFSDNEISVSYTHLFLFHRFLSGILHHNTFNRIYHFFAGIQTIFHIIQQLVSANHFNCRKV